IQSKDQRTRSTEEDWGICCSKWSCKLKLPVNIKNFSLATVSQKITEKLIRRHPHVFGNVEVDSVAEVKANWGSHQSPGKRRSN
ncbi:MAG: hypothetical protein HC810_05870, partial [Acaryochloridaceae cyanobacterium RL_2_7]|nr:hypothetical protein [Acaryochloridaceae cyanobacterium RL_2_7]